MEAAIVGKLLYLTIYEVDYSDTNAGVAIIALGERNDDGEMLIELDPIIFDGEDDSDIAILCMTGLGIDGDRIVTGVTGAKQTFGVTSNHIEGDKSGATVSALLLRMLAEGRLRFVYEVLDEDYPYEIASDIPEVAASDAFGHARNSFTTYFPVQFVNGRFELPPEEDDPPNIDEGEKPEPDAPDEEFS